MHNWQYFQLLTKIIRAANHNFDDNRSHLQFLNVVLDALLAIDSNVRLQAQADIYFTGWRYIRQFPFALGIYIDIVPMLGVWRERRWIGNFRMHSERRTHVCDTGRQAELVSRRYHPGDRSSGIQSIRPKHPTALFLPERTTAPTKLGTCPSLELYGSERCSPSRKVQSTSAERNTLSRQRLNQKRNRQKKTKSRNDPRLDKRQTNERWKPRNQFDPSTGHNNETERHLAWSREEITPAPW